MIESVVNKSVKSVKSPSVRLKYRAMQQFCYLLIVVICMLVGGGQTVKSG